MADHEVRQLARQFKGLWIPASILGQNINIVSKMLWADIDSFSGNGSTWFKSRETVSQEFGVSVRTVARCLKELTDLNLIEAIKYDGRVKHYVAQHAGQFDTSDGSVRHNSEVNVTEQKGQSGTVDNNIGKQDRTQQRSKPQNFDEVLNYFGQNGKHDVGQCEQFFDYYTANGWTQGRGKPIKDWKAAARNWMRNEKKWNNDTGFKADNFTADGLGGFITHG